MTRTTENIGPVQRLKQNKMKTRPPNENFSVAAGPFLATRSSTSLEALLRRLQFGRSGCRLHFCFLLWRLWATSGCNCTGRQMRTSSGVTGVGAWSTDCGSGSTLEGALVGSDASSTLGSSEKRSSAGSSLALAWGSSGCGTGATSLASKELSKCDSARNAYMRGFFGSTQWFVTEHQWRWLEDSCEIPPCVRVSQLRDSRRYHLVSLVSLPIYSF